MKIFDGNFWIVFTLFLVMSAAVWTRGGTSMVGAALGDGARLFLRFGLVIFFSFLVAGLAEALVPKEWVATVLGKEAGWSGLFFATVAGIVTPAGPFVSMPLAAGMLKAGAAPAAVVAYLAAWALLAVHRLFAWEIPILGAPFAVTRWVLCLVLPVGAGALTRLFLRA